MERPRSWRDVIDMRLFFFQAEDGIRDDLVTGVQTCALPIWRRVQPVEHRNRAPGSDVTGGVFLGADHSGSNPGPAWRAAARHRRRGAEVARSGERRVGEEGRSRWSPDHLKKKKKSCVGVQAI